jgi:predicted RNase H-like HicB family nuclease
MTRQFQVLLEWDPEDEVWVTYVPHLDFLSTFGDTREEALEHTREAILGYLEAAAEEGIEVPSAHPTELTEIEVEAS